ncbi:MAG TPA: hypothetical protein VFE92_02210 [Dermatophilaceae bacterium]|nr:hypothetical protein [Dermatophilaceae bacterium]
MGSQVELFEAIRRDRRTQALSIRELAERHKVHRRAVRQALASALPPQRKEYVARSRPAIDPWTTVIDKWLIADQDVHRKQRHTARRVWQRLVAEHGAVLSEVTVSRYVTRRRVELDLVHVEVYIPQSHEPGGEAEVDFGEFYGEGLDVRDASVAPQRTRLPCGAIFDPDTSGRLTQGTGTRSNDRQ